MFQLVCVYIFPFCLLRKPGADHTPLLVYTVAHSSDVRYLHFPEDFLFFLISYFYFFWVENVHYVYVASSQLFLGNAVPRPPSRAHSSSKINEKRRNSNQIKLYNEKTIASCWCVCRSYFSFITKRIDRWIFIREKSPTQI